MACLLIDGLLASCSRCSSDLCLRQQVLNLALDEEENLLCLRCLAQDNGQSREETLERLAAYVATRECFLKSWVKYENDAACPDRQGCLPGLCFKVRQS